MDIVSFRRHTLALSKQIFLSIFCLAFAACSSGNPAANQAASELQKTKRLIGLGTPVCVTDRFRQPEDPIAKKTDILFVMDNSVSMHRHWQLMARSISKLIHELPANEDIRFSVVLGTIQKFTGKLFSAPGEPIVLDHQKLSEAQIMASLEKTFTFALIRDNLDWIGAGEALFYSLHDAVTAKAQQNQALGFFRPDAALNVIFMSDDAEESYPYPSRQIWGLPNKCNWAHHERMRKTYYLPHGINSDSLFADLRRLKGDMPLVTNAFVNITKEDILVDNKLDAHCIYDSPGFGYFDIVKRSGGVLYGIHAEKGHGLMLVGRVAKNRLSLLHDFHLSKPAEKVDPATIKAAVDSTPVDHTYSADTDVVHLENAGQAGSLVEITHCEPVPLPDWSISNFSGTAGQSTANLSWNTGYPTSGKILYGTDAATLNDVAPDSLVSGTHNVALSGLLSNTTYFFQAVSADEFNREQRSQVISLHTQPNWDMGGLSGTASRNSASLSWSTTSYPTVGSLAYGTAPDQLVNSAGPTAAAIGHTLLVEGLNPDSTYFFQATSQDEFGLVKKSSVISLHTLTDWNIVAFQGSALRNTAQLNWQTPEFDTLSELHFGTSSSQLSSVVKDPVAGRTHAVSLSGLAAGTTYFFQAVAQDSLGLVKASSVISLTTLPGWSLSTPVLASTENTFSLTFSTPGFPTDGKVLFGTSADALGTTLNAGANGIDHAATATGLPSDTLFFVQAVATDSLGLEQRSAVLQVRTKAVIDPLPKWVIAGLEGSATTDTVTLNWQTADYPTISTVLWGTSSSSLSNALDEKSAAKIHSMQVAGLSPDTNFFFQVVARDDKGQEARSSVIAVRTQALPLPSWNITGLAAQATATYALVSWQTSDYPTIGNIRYGKNSANLDQVSASDPSPVNSHSQTLAGLDPNTTYFFQATGSDDRGQNKTSALLSFTTLPQWVIAGLAGTSTSDTITLSWQTSGYPTISQVIWGTSADALTNSVNETTATTSHNVPVSGLAPNTNFFFQVVARDDKGQEARSSVISVRTQVLPLPVWSISNLSGTPSLTSIAVAWNTSEYPTIGTVRFGTSATNLDRVTVPEASPLNAHAFTLDGLDPNTSYFIQAEGSDDRGQTKESAVIEVHTLNSNPTWQIAGFDGTTTSNQANLVWQTPGANTNAVIKVGLSATDLSFKTVIVQEFAQTHVVAVNNLPANTTFFFQVVASDQNGGVVSSNVISKKTKARSR